MLSTPAMKVVATAPRPGVMMPSRPVAGLGVEDASLAEPFTNLFSFEQRARRTAARPEAGTNLALGTRFRFIRSRGGGVDVRHALDHGDPGRYGQNDDDDSEHPPVEHEAEQRLRGRQEDDALGALQQADFRVETERLGAGPGVRGEEGADEAEQRRDEQRDAAVDATGGIEHGDAAEHE